MQGSVKSALRNSFVPMLLRTEVESLVDSLKQDCSRLTQGQTVKVENGKVQGVCLVGLVMLQRGNSQPHEIDLSFSEFVARAGDGISPLVRWFDETPKTTMRKELIAELKEILQE